MSEADKGSTESAVEAPRDFIREIIQSYLDAGRVDGLVTRFPPEPNGYLHIGHAKSLCLNFGVAEEFGGRCHLRFDDTNPVKEETLYIDAIKKDVSWLGFDWGEHLYFASDNFEQLYAWAVHLIENGKAYVDDLNAEEMREYRGTLTKPGRNSPHRDRSVEENLDLFKRMRAGEFADGEKVVRAKIDMAAGNINLRDPAIYRILHSDHPRTGDAWCIYPTYDFAHGQTDAIEGITHSLCTLEFEDHRPLYDWFVANLPVKTVPHQYEFSRLSLSHTVLSKRNLKQLVDDGKVSGWDDPRMPTLSGFRRRGYPASAIRTFARQLGFTKSGDSVVEMANLDFFVREALNKSALRRMAVLNPLKVTIENWPEGQVDWMDDVNNPEDEGAGKRKVPFTRELYIERDDFMEDAPKKFFRLSVGREVRFKYGFFVTCNEAIKDDQGEIIELRCTYDPETRSGTNPPDGRKVKATMHWVADKMAVAAEVRLYDRLFTIENPTDVAEDEDWLDNLNPSSLQTLPTCYLEPALAHLTPGEVCQFERLGYFCVDPDTTADQPVFNRTVTLRDAWTKSQKKGG